MLTMHIPTREFFLLLMTKTWLKVPVREMFTILALGFLAEILLLKLQHIQNKMFMWMKTYMTTTIIVKKTMMNTMMTMT